jgi:hypothetical protein
MVYKNLVIVSPFLYFLPSIFIPCKVTFMDDYDGIYPIYKSNNGVYLSVCGDKQGKVGAGQGRAARAAAAGGHARCHFY